MSVLSIVIASYNNRLLLKNCLQSIFKNKLHLTLEVFVIDNASTDGSVEMIKTYFPQVKLIANKTNFYYSKANNQGLKKITGKYFLVLNEDTLIHKNTFSGMIRFMEKHPYCGLASCKEINPSEKILMTCHKFYTPIVQIMELPLFYFLVKNSKLLSNFRYKNWNRSGIRKVDTIQGSFMFGRSKILKKVGYFDKNLVHFYSDDDLCFRVTQAGFAIYHNGQTTITHHTAAIYRQFTSIQILQRSYKDMLVYYQKHYSRFWVVLLKILTNLSLWIIQLVNSEDS